MPGSGCPLLASFRNMIRRTGWQLTSLEFTRSFIPRPHGTPSELGLMCEQSTQQPLPRSLAVSAEPPALPLSASGNICTPRSVQHREQQGAGAAEPSHPAPALAGGCGRCSWLALQGTASPPRRVQGQRLPEQQISAGSSAVSSTGAAEEQREHRGEEGSEAQAGARSTQKRSLQTIISPLKPSNHTY